MELLSSSDDDISRSAAALAAGALVAFPTETVYGLGGDAFNVKALARIFEAKNRPFFDPLIIHIAENATLERLVLREALDKKAREKFDLLVKKFWPGPLTLILPKRPELPDLANAGLPSAAIRFPSNIIAQKLIRLSTGAVAAPSANPFGCLSPTRAEHVILLLGDKADYVIDGGRTGVGLESSVLDITTEPCRLLRPGGVSREQIEAVIGRVEIPERTAENTAQKSPGQMKNHYAPRTPLRLFPRGSLTFPLLPNEGRLYFSLPEKFNEDKTTGEQIRVLSVHGNLSEAAANFFDMLHELDSLGLEIINAEEAPPYGLGAAINDRLRRASSD